MFNLTLSHISTIGTSSLLRRSRLTHASLSLGQRSSVAVLLGPVPTARQACRSQPILATATNDNSTSKGNSSETRAAERPHPSHRGGRFGATSGRGGAADGRGGTAGRRPNFPQRSGRGRGHGRGGDRDGNSTRDFHGRSGPPSSSSSGSSQRVGDARDIVQLAAIVEGRVEEWAAAAAAAARGGPLRMSVVGDLRAAFNVLGKLGAAADDMDPDARRRTLAVFDTLAAAYLPLVPRLADAFSCVVPLWACAKLGLWTDGPGSLARALLARLGGTDAAGARVLVRGATAQGHANLWWALSRAPRELVDTAAAGVLRESAACLLLMASSELQPQDCSNVLLACARLQWYERPDLVSYLTGCLAAHPNPDNQHLANTFYSLGELAEDCGHQIQPQELERLAERVAARVEGCWTHADRQEEQQRVPEGQQQVQQQQPWRGRRGGAGGGFSPQELSNMLLGCAKLGYDPPALLQPLAAAAGAAAPGHSSQGLANCLYALARLGCTDTGAYGPTVQSLCVEAVQRLGSPALSEVFKPQELSNLLLALEGLRPEGVRRYAAVVAGECGRRGFAGFGPQEISNSVWAKAKVDSAPAETVDCALDRGFYEQAVEAVLRPGVMDGAQPQAWSNLLYGLALVRHRPDEDLVRAMEAEGQRGPLGLLRARANAQDCANLLWALAVLGLHHEGLTDALVGRLGALLLERDRSLVGEQHLANSLWALAVMGPAALVRRHGAVVGQMLREVAGRQQEAAGSQEAAATGSQTSRERLAQLLVVQHELEHAALGGDSSARELAGELAQALAHAHASPGEGFGWVRESRPSRVQQQVAASLAGLQWQLSGGGGELQGAISSVQLECDVEGLGCRVDVLVELAGGRRVAVEVDGPWHFLANAPHTRERTGRTRMRDRQLERVFGAGNVVSVPHWEWRALRLETQRQEYLAGLLGLG